MSLIQGMPGRLQRSNRRLFSALVVAVLGLLVSGMPTVQAQRIVDTSPRFAADTASAMARPSFGGAVGGSYNVGGFPYGYSVRLAGQNPYFPFSAYANPRQFGAHDHGYQHVRHADQARYNQFGRNHWVVSPIVPYPCFYPRICGPYRPNCFPYPVGYCYPLTFGYRPALHCWNGWGWSPLIGCGGFGFDQWNSGVVQWNGSGFGQGVFGGQGMLAFPGLDRQDPGAWSAVDRRSDSSAFAPVEIPLAPGAVAGGLIQRRAEDVIAQHRAVAELESAESQTRRKTTVSTVGSSNRTIVDPLGRESLKPTSDLKTTEVIATQKTEKIQQTPSAESESLASRRISQAEAERKRLLDKLRQK
jgi:hypothetical protein